MQNKKELIRPRPAALHACEARTTRARSQERAISPTARNYLAPGFDTTLGGSILPVAQTTRTRHQRGAIFYLCGEYELDLLT